jgi:rubrerythrin
MDWKLFFSTFVLVFIAELGDKTQLTALAASSGAKSPWSVFAGASLALVTSTLIAVLVGTALTKAFPDRILKLVAGGLFLLFGAILIVQNAKPSSEPEAQQMTITTGALTSFVLDRAKEFEKASYEDYLAAAEKVNHPELKALLLSIANDESNHIVRLEGRESADEVFTESDTTLECPEFVRVNEDDGDEQILRNAIAHERSTAEFYSKLSATVHIPALKPLFQNLSLSERQHLEQLKNFAEQRGWNL